MNMVALTANYIRENSIKHAKILKSNIIEILKIIYYTSKSSPVTFLFPEDTFTGNTTME
jgi:hypothetical protein